MDKHSKRIHVTRANVTHFGQNLIFLSQLLTVSIHCKISFKNNEKKNLIHFFFPQDINSSLKAEGLWQYSVVR